MSDLGAFALVGLALLALPYLGVGGLAFVIILHFWLGISWLWAIVPALMLVLGLYIFYQA